MQRFALRWYHKVMLKQQVRRKQLVLSLAQNEKSYALSLRALGETYGSPAFEPFTRLPEVASLFADMFLLLSYHNNLHDTLSQRYLRWNVDSCVGDLFQELVRLYLCVLRFNLLLAGEFPTGGGEQVSLQVSAAPGNGDRMDEECARSLRHIPRLEGGGPTG